MFALLFVFTVLFIDYIIKTSLYMLVICISKFLIKHITTKYCFPFSYFNLKQIIHFILFIYGSAIFITPFILMSFYMSVKVLLDSKLMTTFFTCEQPFNWQLIMTLSKSSISNSSYVSFLNCSSSHLFLLAISFFEVLKWFVSPFKP